MKDLLKLIRKNSIGVSRDSGSLKIIFFPGELAKKPIRFWANVGRIPKLSKLEKTIKEIKSMLGIGWANNVSYLSYYSGGRIVSPYHCQWMNNEFEFCIWDFLGQKQIFYLRRKVKNQNEFFTAEEIKQISGVLEGQFHLIRKGFEDLQAKIGNPENYNDYLTKIKSL